MLITTSENIPGKNIVSTIGYVKGSSARARHAVADVFASLKNLSCQVPDVYLYIPRFKLVPQSTIMLLVALEVVIRSQLDLNLDLVPVGSLYSEASAFNSELRY